MSKPRYCVVGAGTAGICAAKHALVSGGEVIVFEQTSELGGTWVYSDQIGTDKYGIEVHTSMYKGLRTNLPKEVMGYPDFPIAEQEQSYIPAADMLAFIKSYADNFGIRNLVKFEHYVLRIRPMRDDKTWEVIVRDLPNDKLYTYYFDYVLVCNGHYHTPNMPHYEGMDVYKGLQIHSHDYRCADPFEGKNVLVIGAGPSGMDLAYEISKKAKKVTLSHHLEESPKTVYPSNVDQRPDVVRLTEQGVEFTDGSKQNYDVIFYCTGYRYAFPFLSSDCGIIVEDNYVQPLYKHCINITRPSMAFIGLPYYVCAAQMFDIQARFAIKFYSGAKSLSSKEDMTKDTEHQMEMRWKRGYKKRQAHMMGPDQLDYFDQLAKVAEIEPLKPVLTKLHNESSQRFLDDLINFRKDVFRILDDENFVQVQ